MQNARVRRVFSLSSTVVLAVAISLLVIAPLTYLQTTALEDGGASYGRLVDLPNLGKILFNTLVLGFGSLITATVIGTGLAWTSLRLPPRMAWMSAIPLLPLVIPALALVIAYFFLLSPGPGYINSVLRATPMFGGAEGPFNVYSLLWMVLIAGFSLSSFIYVFVRSGLRNVNHELMEAGLIGGSSPRRVFFGITLPLLRPSLVYGCALVLLLGLGQITVPLLLGTIPGIHVLTTEIYRTSTVVPTDFPLAAALGTPLLVFGIGVVFLQRALLGDGSRFVTHSGKAFRGAIRPTWIAPVWFTLFGFFAMVLPLFALLSVALSPFWSGTVDPSVFSLDNFRNLLARPEVQASIKNSITYSLGAVAVSIPLGFTVATVVIRRSLPRPLLYLLDTIAFIPLGVPAVLFGVGFLYTYLYGPVVLYGTPWVVILVYVTLMLPFTTRLLMAGLLSIGTAYEEASRVNGAGVLRTKIEIVLPLMRSAITGAIALVVVILAQEFSASVLVRSRQTQVMGTQMYDLWTSAAGYGQVAAFGLIMCGVTAIGVLAAWAAGGRDVLRGL